MIIEEEARASLFTGLINSSVKFQDEQENAEEDASDRDKIYDQARRDVADSHINHRQAKNQKTMQATIALTEQQPKK